MPVAEARFGDKIKSGKIKLEAACGIVEVPGIAGDVRSNGRSLRTLGWWAQADFRSGNVMILESAPGSSLHAMHSLSASIASSSRSGLEIADAPRENLAFSPQLIEGCDRFRKRLLAAPMQEIAVQPIGVGAARDAKLRSDAWFNGFDAFVNSLKADMRIALKTIDLIAVAAKNARTSFLEAAQRAAIEVYREPLTQAAVWPACAGEWGQGSGFKHRVRRPS